MCHFPPRTRDVGVEPARRRLEGEQKAYRQGVDAGIRQGLGMAVHLLMEARVPPEYHDPIHERIDLMERLKGDMKREPRSRRYKKEWGFPDGEV